MERCHQLAHRKTRARAYAGGPAGHCFVAVPHEVCTIARHQPSIYTLGDPGRAGRRPGIRADRAVPACSPSAGQYPGLHRRGAADPARRYQYQSVQASAAIRIRLAAADAAAGVGDPRITIADLIDVFLAAWETAALVIPLALVEDPAAVPLAGPPLAELYVRAGEKYVDGRPEYKELPHVLDLSPLGKATGSQLRQGGISVTAPLEIGRDERLLLVRQAVARMAANQWGFIEVDDDLDIGVQLA